MQLYELLSVFSKHNSTFDDYLRNSLLVFGYQLDPSYSINLSDFLDLDVVMAKWSSVLVVEMRAWVDSVLSVSCCIV